MAPFLNGSLTRRAHAVTVQILLLLLSPSSHRRYGLVRGRRRQVAEQQEHEEPSLMQNFDRDLTRNLCLSPVLAA